MIRKFLIKMAAACALALPGMALADPLAKDVFGSTPGPTAGRPAAVGFYSKGCISGAVQLPETGPAWQAMRLSRNRNWGHPEMISLLTGLSHAARQAGWLGLYIGDISQPRGGPMITGHASHQLGLDADIWMLPPSSLTLSRQQRENLSSVSVVNKAGTALNGNWTPGHLPIIRAAASDPRVERVFLDPVVKLALCQGESGNRSWLRKLRPLNGHDYHFHIRLACPAGSVCQQQDAPPPGDGCDEAAEWIRNRIDPSRVKPVPPDPDYRHPRSFRLSEMPPQCQIIGTAR